MGGWLEKAEIKPTQPSWSLSLAELGNYSVFPGTNLKEFNNVYEYLNSLIKVSIKEITCVYNLVWNFSSDKTEEDWS